MSRPTPLSAARVLEAPIVERPDAEATVARSGRLTYRQLDELAERSRRALWSAGLRPGQRVAVSLPNDLAIVGTFHGAMRLGAVWVGLNRQLAAPEKRYIIEDCTASLFVGDAEMVAQLEGAGGDLPALVTVEQGPGTAWADLLSASAPSTPPPDPLAPAAIAYTSGTTGFPKGAVHSQHNLMLPGAAMVGARGYTAALRKADCFPFTILNLQVLSTLLVPQCGGTAIVMDRVDPVGIAEWLTAERAMVFNGAPAMLYGLAHNDEVDPSALAGLSECWSGGSHLPESTRAPFREKFTCPLCTTYGLTEAPTLVAITSPEDQDHLRTSGKPLEHLEVAVLDAEGAPLEVGATGEICLRGTERGPWAGAYRPMLGYWERAEATAAALREGWLHTGDLGSLDAEGYLHVADRQSSLILRGGANVYPAEVERVIEAFPGVAASCVVGVADDRLGERVVAAVEVVAGAELDPEALRAYCGANLARYKVPERIVVGPLTRNSMGKVSRRDVLAHLGGPGD